MTSRAIAGEWAELRRRIIPADAPAWQVEDCRGVYYAGAWAMLQVLRGIADPARGLTAGQLAMLRAVEAEIEQFLESLTDERVH